MKKVFVLIFTFFCFHYGASKVLRRSIGFEDCGGKLDLVSISISTCNYIPCKLMKGNMAEVTIEFDPSNSPYQATALLFDANWIVDGLTQPALLIPDYCTSDGCLRNSTNGLMTFTARIYVSDTLPRGLGGYLQLKAAAGNGDLMLCSRIPVYIY